VGCQPSMALCLRSLAYVTIRGYMVGRDEVSQAHDPFKVSLLSLCLQHKIGYCH
jgi:hypothetical protein